MKMLYPLHIYSGTDVEARNKFGEGEQADIGNDWAEENSNFNEEPSNETEDNNDDLCKENTKRRMSIYTPLYQNFFCLPNLSNKGSNNTVNSNVNSADDNGEDGDNGLQSIR